MKVKRMVYKALARLCNNILPLFFWLLLIFGFDKPYIGVLTVITAIIHEIGHYSVKLFVQHEGEIPIAHLSGFRLKNRRLTSYEQDVLLLSAGPLINIVVFVILLPFFFSHYVRTLAYINLATAVSNLLPISGYDGHSILLAVCRKSENDDLVNLLNALSFAFSAMLTLLALYMIYRLDTGYWIFALFTVNILSEMQKSQNKGIREN